MTEVKLTYEGLKKLWAGIMDDPYEEYLETDNEMWNFVYETKRCPDVLKTEFWSIDFHGHSDDLANDDANEVINRMGQYWRDDLIEKYAKKHPEIHEAFNEWWWSNHNIENYMEDEEE